MYIIYTINISIYLQHKNSIYIFVYNYLYRIFFYIIIHKLLNIINLIAVNKFILISFIKFVLEIRIDKILCLVLRHISKYKPSNNNRC